MSRKYLESKGYTSARFQLIKVAPAIWEAALGGYDVVWDDLQDNFCPISDESSDIRSLASDCRLSSQPAAQDDRTKEDDGYCVLEFKKESNKSRFCDWDGRKTRARIKRTNGRKNKSLCQDDGGVYAW
ncbi:hypothetical protein GQX74_015115 [Glossina fuscipes]|nr:hypothetical protein GQX74_015115 [Glossina fuscipes]